MGDIVEGAESFATTPDTYVVVTASQESRHNVEALGLCSFGEHMNGHCAPIPHKTLQSLPRDESVALVWASGTWKATTLSTICQVHRDQLLLEVGPANGEDKQLLHCADPLQCHFKKIKTSLRNISYLFALKAKARGILLNVGKKVCDKCRVNIMALPQLVDETEEQVGENCQTADISSDMPLSSASVEEPALKKIKVGSEMKTLNIHPSEQMQRSKKARIEEAKLKISENNSAVINNFCILFDLNPEDITNEERGMGTEFMNILSQIKQQLPSCNRRRKLQLLTLCPSFWSLRTASKYFEVSRYLIKKAKELRSSHGILAEPPPLTRNKISPEVREVILKFYENGDNSRVMPGKKDKKSLGKGQHAQKILLLSNLKELYQLFKKENPEIDIGFSLFCLLRPNWCVLAGLSGTHSVCVCKTHQNVKLLLHALPLKENYRQLLAGGLMCDPNSRLCGLRLCSKCPDNSDISNILTQKIFTNLGYQDETEEVDEEFYMEVLKEKVDYQEWIQTDRAELKTCSGTLQEVIELCAKKVSELIPHDFINIKQKEYFKNLKENLSDETVIVVMDFSMNYSCEVQDAIQSHHWSKRQATLHPTIIYFKGGHQSFCFMTDDLNHDTAQVYLAQKYMVDWIEKNLPKVTIIQYFTDGCAQQYKNCQNFLNLCRHKERFGLEGTFNFFATSHGKSPCDGLGGTIKREAVKASLQRPLKDQITDAIKLFEFCQANLSKNIIFVFLNKSQIDGVRMQEKVSGIKPSTVPGTRSFHCFIPIAGYLISCKRFSSDINTDLVHGLSTKKPTYLPFSSGAYALVTIDRTFYVGFISDINDDEEEADVTLLHPPLPSTAFSWPDEELACFSVPFPHIYCPLKLEDCQDNVLKIYEEDINKVRTIIGLHS